jgi:hypothetical protein
MPRGDIAPSDARGDGVGRPDTAGSGGGGNNAAAESRDGTGVALSSGTGAITVTAAATVSPESAMTAATPIAATVTVTAATFGLWSETVLSVSESLSTGWLSISPSNTSSAQTPSVQVRAVLMGKERQCVVVVEMQT